MRFKIDPEIIRLIASIAAAVQLFASLLTGTDVLPVKVLIVMSAATAAVAGWCAAYSQGVRTPISNRAEDDRVVRKETDQGI